MRQPTTTTALLLFLISLFTVSIIPARASSTSTTFSAPRPSALLFIPRGGASSGGVLRDAIQSVLKQSKQRSPLVYKLVKRFLQALERVTGITLLDETTKQSRVRPKKRSNHDHETKSNHEKKRRKKRSNSKNNTSTTTTTTTTSNKHISHNLHSNNPNYRIQRELKEFMRDPPSNLSVKVGTNIRIWIITMIGAPNTIYEGEVYKLRVFFPPGYPTVPPSVYFKSPPPLHEHVYTNGDICLSLLGKDWKPTMTAQSIALSILSILSSASTKSLPMDNARHSQNKPGQYQKDWVYHDDNC